MYDIPNSPGGHSTVPASLTKVIRHGQITLPTAIRRAVNVNEGDYVEVRVGGDAIILTPKKLIDKSQAYCPSGRLPNERPAPTSLPVGCTSSKTVEDLIAGLEAED